jgi:cytochrome b
MSILNQSIEAGGVAPPAEVKVWDSFVRLFHWSLVGLFVLAYATGDEIEKVHIAAGYTIAALMVARVLWGFIGPHHARFANFVRPPGEMLANLRDAVRLRAPRYLGHNPAGAAMIIALILMISGTCVTGYMMTTQAYWGAKWVEQFHQTLANASVALIVLHILGVIVVSFEHKENLVKAMVTGMKRKLD